MGTDIETIASRLERIDSEIHVLKRELLSLKGADERAKRASEDFVAAAMKKKRHVKESAVFIIREDRKKG